MVKWKVAVVAALAAVMTLVAAGSAAAESDRAVLGHNWAQIRDGHFLDSIVIACDGEADGHYVFAQYHLVGNDGLSKYLYVFDLDGANNNSCGTENWDYQPVYVRAVRVCEQDEGCSDWVYFRTSAAGVTVKSGS